jgi:hypothetical protein
LRESSSLRTPAPDWAIAADSSYSQPA